MTKSLFASVFLLTANILNAQTLKEAIRLNENEQQDAASAVYQKLISAEPTNGNNFYYYGENLIDADKLDSAKTIFEKGLQADPANPINNIGLAELKLLQGNITEAKTLIDDAVKKGNNKNALLLMEAAEAYTHYKQKDLISALALLDQAVKLDPKNPEVYNLMGDVYSEQNNGTLAASNYNKAIDLDKNQVKPLLHKGQLYKRSNNYDGSAAEFQNALKIDPNFAPAYRELGEVSFKQRKLTEAKEYYKKYLELSKNNTGARLRYIYFLYESTSYNDAVAEMNLITKVDSTNLGMMRIFSYVTYEAGRNDTALKTINKVFEITSTDTSRRFARDYSYMGKILAKAGNDSIGAGYVQSALNMDPKQAELYDDLADIYNRTKTYDKLAQTYSNKIANVNKPTSADYYNLGKAWYSAKDYMKADTAFIKVTELNPTWPNGFFWRGRSNFQQDLDAKKNIAGPYFEKFLELAYTDTVYIGKNKGYVIEANRYLAFAAFVMKDCPKAISFYTKILELDPMDKPAKDASESVKKSKDCK